MKDILRFILENVNTRKIDQKVAIQLIKDLKKVKISKEDDIAIIGMAVNLPQAENINKFWKMLCEQGECLGEFSGRRKDDILKYLEAKYGQNNYLFQRGAYLNEIDKFDYEFFNISLKEASLMDPNHRLFLQTVYHVIEDAGYDMKNLQGSKTGIYIGQSNNTGESYKDLIKTLSLNEWNYSYLNNVNSVMAGRVAFFFDFRGPSVMVDTACSSSLAAVNLACNAIKRGDCDAAIVGGVNINLVPVINEYTIYTGIESASDKTKTFDEDADGTILGEGSAAIFIKPLQKALKDNDRIYSVIKAVSINQDGYSIGITAPNPEAQYELILKTWHDAKINPEKLGYIELNGTGTKLGDPMEAESIDRAFQKYTKKHQFCAVGSVKTNIGHLDSAAGIIGLIKVGLMLDNRLIPPSLHFLRPNKKINLINSSIYLNDHLRKWERQAAAKRLGCISSFGLRGTNCHVVMEEGPKNLINSDSPDSYFLIALSAKNLKCLKEILRQYLNLVAADLGINLGNISYTANTGRKHLNCRLAILAPNSQELGLKINNLLQHGINNAPNEGIYFNEYKIVNLTTRKMLTNEFSEDKIKAISQIINSQLKDLEELKEIFTNENLPILNELGRYYISGADINWSMLYQEGRYQKINLPLYPFLKTRCWLQDLSKGDTQFETKARNVNLSGRDNNCYHLIEKTIANIWGNLLGYNQIDLADNFFALGGNSLVYLQFANEMSKVGVQFNFSAHEYPVLADLAQAIINGSVDHRVKLKSSTLEFGFYENSESDAKLSIDLANKKVLNDIKAFNNIMFKGCFYNAFLPIVKYFKKDIRPYFANEMIFYGCNTSATEINAQYLSCDTLLNINQKNGLISHGKLVCQNVIKEIENCIFDKIPVIVAIDCFFEPSKKDTYLKIHWPHYLLVYGLNKRKKEMTVLENINKDSLYYTSNILRYADIENCYGGYQENFNSSASEYKDLAFDEQDQNSFYYFVPNEESINREIKIKTNHELVTDTFYRNLIRHQKEILAGIKGLERFSQNLNQAIINKTINEKFLRQFMNSSTAIINLKKVESFRLAGLFPDNVPMINLINDINKNWILLRSCLFRILNNQSNGKDWQNDIYNNLISILEMEQRFNEKMFKMAIKEDGNE